MDTITTIPSLLKCNGSAQSVTVAFTPSEIRLIAAAPDMLEALTQCVLQLQYLADKFGETGTGAAVLARVIAVIEKAEGSTAVHMGRDAS